MSWDDLPVRDDALTEERAAREQRAREVLDRVFPMSGRESGPVMYDGAWLGVDGVGIIERLRSTINDRNYAAASRLSRSLVGCVAREIFPTNDVQWLDDHDSRPRSFETDDTFSFGRVLLTVAGVKFSACPFVSFYPQTQLAAIDVASPIRINLVLGDAERDFGDQSRPMLSVYVSPDGSLMTYEGSAGERVMPTAWLDRCRQIKDGLVSPAPVHAELTMPDAHRVAPLDDAADLGL